MKRTVNLRKGKIVTPAQTLKLTSTRDRIAKPARRAQPKLARDTQTRTRVGLPPLRLVRKRNIRNPNVVAQDRRKNLTSLVRRQAANTSLSRDQGSIRFFLFINTVYSHCVFHCDFSGSVLVAERKMLNQCYEKFAV